MPNVYNHTRFNLKNSAAAADNAIVSFGGIDISHAVPHCRIIDIVVYAPEIATSAYDASSSGVRFVSNRHKARRIAITVELPLSPLTYARDVNFLQAWAYSKEPKGLTLSCYPGKFLDACTCTSFGAFNPKTWWLPIEIEFTAWNPYFLSLVPKTASVGDAFTITGNASPLLSIEQSIDSPLVSPKWIIDNSEFVKIVDGKTISPCELMIDFDAKVVLQNGESIMRFVSLQSRFPELFPGTHSISGPSGGIVKWYERWM